VDDPKSGAGIRVVPANAAAWEDIQTIFGDRGDAARCQCQRYKLGWTARHEMSRDELRFRLHDQTDCGHPESETTSGIVAYVDGQPAGWCAIEPRSYYPYLTRTVWGGRNEDPDDESVWSATCFVVRVGFRRRGITYALAEAAVDFARSRGARALEAYPMITHPDQEITWGELHVGALKVFAAAGFREILHPSKRRYVVRIDF
jgi:GNAT superfamily N-acetyltransferase